MDLLCQQNQWYRNIIQDVSRLNNYVDRLENMSSQERFELLLDQDWNGGEMKEKYLVIEIYLRS